MWILIQQAKYWSHILHLSNTWEKGEYYEAVHQLFIDFKKTYDSFMGVALCNILIEFGILMKLVRLIKKWLDETYSTVWASKNLSDIFPVMNGLKQWDALLKKL